MSLGLGCFLSVGILDGMINLIWAILVIFKLLFRGIDLVSYVLGGIPILGLIMNYLTSLNGC